MQKVSLLITTYNVKDQISATLDSIRSQDYASIETVIVDGGSQDGTLDVVREFAAQYPAYESCLESKDLDEAAGIIVKWISEPDRGLYDAMNKAWAMCSGDIVAVCNDRLCTPDAVTKLVRAIEKGGRDCIGAHADLVYMDGERVIRTWHMGEGRLAQGWMPGHPTLFLKREIYEKYGHYDISYHCAADYEFMVRFLKDEKNHLAYVPEVLVSMFYGGTSNAGLRNYLVSFKEGYLALKKNGVPHPFLITVKRTFRVLRQF
ncbi:MAG: glycosyltransferase [Lachnospiraceae bacterium]|nr:glycosyltransferase [Lachnospiraceae bacterium]